MAQRCTACTHAQRKAIDQALLTGSSIRDVARRFGLSRAAAHRHTRHLHRAVSAVVADDPIAYGRVILGQVRTLTDRAVRILDRAEDEGDLRAATGAIREARSCLELVAKLEGQIIERHAHEHIHSEFEATRQKVVEVRKMPAELQDGLRKAAHWQVLHGEHREVEDAEVIN